jgi:hypothetical protein
MKQFNSPFAKRRLQGSIDQHDQWAKNAAFFGKNAIAINHQDVAFV